MEQKFSSLNRVMEPETISKNGASPKSLMSRGNFKIIAILAFALSIFIFTGCSTVNEETPPEEILSCDKIESSIATFTTLNVKIGPSYADSWGITGYAFELFKNNPDDDGKYKRCIVAESNSNSKQQTFTFRDNVPDEFLEDFMYDTYYLGGEHVGEYFGKSFRLLQWDIPKGSESQLQNISISNPNTKIAIIDYGYIRIFVNGVMGTDDGPDILGRSVQAQMMPDYENTKLECRFKYCDLVYSNSDCNITGIAAKQNYTASVDIRLKKGWNKVFTFADRIITTNDVKDSYILWYQNAG